MQLWLAAAGAHLRTWEPSPLNDLLTTERRRAYQSLIEDPDGSLEFLKGCLSRAKVRPARPYHIQNIEAPGGCWELGTQIVPHKTRVTPAFVLDKEDHARHLCNNRACYPTRPSGGGIGPTEQTGRRTAQVCGQLPARARPDPPSSYSKDIAAPARPLCPRTAGTGQIAWANDGRRRTLY